MAVSWRKPNTFTHCASCGMVNTCSPRFTRIKAGCVHGVKQTEMNPKIVEQEIRKEAKKWEVWSQK